MKKIANRKQYIGTLKECLKARDDFKDLEYVTDVRMISKTLNTLQMYQTAKNI